MTPRTKHLLGLGLLALCGTSLLLYARAKATRSSSQPVATPAQAQARPVPATAEIRALTPGKPLAGELAPGETHSYRIEVAAEHFLHVVVDQRGVDAKATLLDPDGRRLIQIDRPIDDVGPEPLMTVAEATGGFTVGVSAASGKRPTGRYEIRVEHLRPATMDDRSRAAAMLLFSDAKARYGERDYRRAAEGFGKALAAWSEQGDLSWQGESLVRLGQAHAKLREWEKAAIHYQRAASLFHEDRNARWEAIALQKLGVVYFSLRKLARATSSYEQALDLRRIAGDRRGEAITLHSLAQTFQVQDEVQRALDAYSSALKLFERPKNRAQTLHNLGVLYISLGRLERAREALQQAENAWSEAGDHRRQAYTLNQLGELYRELGKLDLAQDYYQQALDLRRRLADRRGEVTSLANIGLVLQARGEADRASAFYLQALEILSDLQRPRLEARVLLNIGSLHLEQDRDTKALDKFRASLALYKQVEDPTGEAEALLGLARAERQRGNHATALEDSETALGIFESIRPRAISPELRSSFFATVQDYFEFYIDLLMESHRSRPDAGYDARALVGSERARARSLLDLLAEAGAKIRRDTTPALLERERELQRRLNARERQRFDLRHSSQFDERALATVEKTIDLALRQLQEVRGEIRARHPRYAALTQPLGLREIQKQVLDDDTLLLEYRLGEKRSFLWALTPHSLHSFDLPRREVIEQLALKAYDLLVNSHRREAREATRDTLCELGHMLLQPVARQMAGKRLLVVADGALQFIPFAVLAKPESFDQGCAAAEPLVTDYEITHLPSASALAIHRRQLAARPPAKYSVAVVADPVFSPSDERLTSLHGASPGDSADNPAQDANGSESGITRSADVEYGSFTRLPFSRREADAILALSTEKSFSALDFDASKESIARGVLADYRVVHFATHGVLNARHPELSGIVLSLVDRQGKLQDGFLRAHEIYNLELASELVVLSACSTALGKGVRGEGLLSLTRGFMYAGAERVMVSLWNVNDQSTAELMELFYRGLLEQKLRPAAALREAQRAMWADEKRSAPYHWAGFVIQGEWR